MAFSRGQSIVHHESGERLVQDPRQLSLYRRTQQLLYFECDIYTINRTLLKAYENFSEERANILFEKYARKKVTRSIAHFLIDRISFQRKGAFGSKPFRKEVTYREIKYFFAWSARPEYFMFCVTDEKMRRNSYEIYRCDDTQDVHSVCAFVYKATNDSQFILRNELPVDVISQSMNEMDESLISLDSAATGTAFSPNDSIEPGGWNKRSPVSIDRVNATGRNTYSQNGSTNQQPLFSNHRDEVISIVRERPSSGPHLNRNHVIMTNATPNAIGSQRRATDVYSFYERSPNTKPKRFPSWGTLSNESTNRTITITRKEEKLNQKDFSAQSGVSLVNEATSPFLSTPTAIRRSAGQKVDTLSSPFEPSRHSISSTNVTISADSQRPNYITLKEFDTRGKHYVFKESSVLNTQKQNDRTILYASSESFFDQPLSSDGPLYMYVTYLDSDSQFGGSSTLSRASTRTGTSRTMFEDETTDA